MEETWTSKFSNESLNGIYNGNGTRTVDKETCYIVKHNVSEADEVVESLNPITVSKVFNKDGKFLGQATARMVMAIRRLYTADVPYTGPSHDNKCFTPTTYTQAPAKVSFVVDFFGQNLKQASQIRGCAIKSGLGVQT